MAPRLNAVLTVLLCKYTSSGSRPTTNSKLDAALVIAFAVLLPSHRAFAAARTELLDSQLDSPPSEEQRDNYWTQGGNDIVHEVWSVLRDFEPTWKDSVTPVQPTGLLPTAWHYARIIFRALFMNTPNRDDHEGPKVNGDLKRAVDTLRTASSFDDPDAIYLLAEMNFYGNFSHPRDFHAAKYWYGRLADLDGNATAQHMLGLMYATGIGGVERDQAKALLYHTFAAEQDNIQSEMTLAFRYHAGIGCPRDCDQAVGYYKRVADKAMEYWYSGPPGGNSFVRNAYRWVEVDGGIYGEGASVSSSGPNAPRDGVTTAHIDYILDYLDTKERQGDYNAMLTLGKHYYEAPRGYKKNFRKAQRQFMKVARAYWTKDGKVSPKAPKGIERVAGKAAAYIGRMFLRGEAMEQNFEKALTWFKRGVAQGDSFAQYHMGVMYRDGLGVPQDGVRAGAYLKAAAEQSLPLAQSALGVLFLDQGDIDTAARYFELAAGAGVMESFYYLAELTDQGVGRERNCGLAAAYYKVVAERAEILHSSFMEANSAYERGDFERAFIPSIMAAEQGYENAQANVAYLLDRKTQVISLPFNLDIPLLSAVRPSNSAITKRSKLLNDPELALSYFTRSAKQANVDSLIKMGDYYLSMSSSSQPSPAILPTVETNDTQTNLDKATTCYTTAAESYHSAQALWNLGWMHENGIGSVSQDFHMAKRYYDLALEMNKEAYLPVKLALVKLRARSWWNGVSGGKVNGIKDEEEDGKKRWRGWAEWVNRFLDAAEEMDAREAEQFARENGGGDDELLGYTADRAGDGEYATRDHDDARRVEGDVYVADEWDEFDDGFVESLIIIALAGALALLVYARQARQRVLEEERRQGQNQQNQNHDQNLGQHQHHHQQDHAQAQAQGRERERGMFPAPGDPDWNNWVAGGIGH
ncbi:putative ubiquitin-protein ligase Sel1/Ubx2 [Cladophialophora carrionii]|uniref:Putative ubiquitin-protein ligase Sel1/Ubx2 n=1 Tax=Cladophialophora carrionii TaxID=86049 RepID=A0A1C1CN63_9EURO|nr:putative ubiquitin-protein ligase Sel1/Ubx2 [Cladophialophora carrionii]